jgi:hypothetical protein
MAGAVYNQVAATAYANPAIPSAPSLPRTEAIPMPAVMPPGGLGYAPPPPAYAPPHGHFGAAPNGGGSGFGPVPHAAPVAAAPFHGAHPHAMNPGYAMPPQGASSSNRLMIVTLALGIIAGMLVTGTIVMVQRRKNHRAATANGTLVPPPAASPYYPAPQIAPTANTNATPVPAAVDAGAHTLPAAHATALTPTHAIGTAVAPGQRAAHATDPSSQNVTDDAGSARAGSGWTRPRDGTDDPPPPSGDAHRASSAGTGSHSGHGADPPGGEQQFEEP